MTLEFLHKELSSFKKARLYRSLRKIRLLDPVRAEVEGREVVLFCSNNYLGLTHHPRVVQAARTALETYGTGGSAARLVSGHTFLHAALEEELARFKKVPRALVFPTGYAANLAVIATILGKEDVIFCDRLAHASLIDGCFLSGAKLLRFRHNDLSHLLKLLKTVGGRRQLIVTEGVFSMDGDLAPLGDIRDLALEHNCLLLVDDAHGTGVLGPGGCGTVAHQELAPGGDLIQVGTLSKALGSLGGFVAGEEILIEYLINKARPFIFTTALPPATVASALEALRVIRDEPEHLERLRENVRILRDGLQTSGLQTSGFTVSSRSPIIPIVIGTEERALALSQKLFDRGFHVPAIRPPAVPRGTARLRITVSAAHTTGEIHNFLAAITKSTKELKLVE